MLQEPLLVVGAFYILFFTVIIYVRLDFAITKVTQQTFYNITMENFNMLNIWRTFTLKLKLFTRGLRKLKEHGVQVEPVLTFWLGNNS